MGTNTLPATSVHPAEIDRSRKHRNFYWKPANDGTKIWHTPMWGGRVYGEPVSGDLVAAACMAAYGPHGAKMSHRMQRVMRVGKLVSMYLRRMDGTNPNGYAGNQNSMYHRQWVTREDGTRGPEWVLRTLLGPEEKGEPFQPNPGSVSEIERRKMCAPGGIKLWSPVDETKGKHPADKRIYWQCGNKRCPFCYQRKVQQHLTDLRAMADRKDPWWGVRWQVPGPLIMPKLVREYKSMGWVDSRRMPDEEHCLFLIDRKLRNLARASRDRFKKLGCTGAVVVRPRIMLTKLWPVYELTYIGVGDRPEKLLRFPGKNRGTGKNSYSRERRKINQLMEVYDWSAADAPWQIARTAFSRPGEWFYPKREEQYWWIESLLRGYKTTRMFPPKP